MEKVNLRNMPSGKLYEFAKCMYIWKIKRPGGTRSANYLTSMSDIHEYTEVFRLGNNGKLWYEWGGMLVENPYVFGENGLDANGCFSIFSYDQDCSSRFAQEQDLVLAPPEIQSQAENQEREIVDYIRGLLSSPRTR